MMIREQALACIVRSVVCMYTKQAGPRCRHLP